MPTAIKVVIGTRKRAEAAQRNLWRPAGTRKSTNQTQNCEQAPANTSPSSHKVERGKRQRPYRMAMDPKYTTLVATVRPTA